MFLLAGAALPGQVRFDLHADRQLPGYAYDWPMVVDDFAAGDVDGDGDLDLVVNGGYWRNAGDGSFPEFVPQPIGGRCIALADLDGDGDLDCAAGGGTWVYSTSGGAYVALNDGAGNFTVAPSPSTMLLLAAIRAGDLDGDGDADLVLFGEAFGAIECWRNDGVAGFTDVTAAVLPPGSVGGPGILFDADGDGDLDVLASSAYRNDGTGVFTPESAWNGAAVAAADLDGDGDDDLVFLGAVARNDGGGVFGLSAGLPGTSPPGPNFWKTNRLSAADFDGDGLIDLVGTPRSAAPVLLRNTGNFTFVDVSAAWFAADALVDRTRGYTFTTSLVFDADGDGRPDLVTGGAEGRNSASTTIGIPPKLFLNGGGQRLVEATGRALPMVQHYVFGPIADVGDVDGDGLVDFVVGHDGGAEVWTQGPDGRFQQGAGLPPLPVLSALHLLDIDGDGDLDLFGVHGWGVQFPGVSGAHVLLQNDGTGHFTDVTAARLPPTAVSGGAGCVSGDVDGDGDLDLVVGSGDTTWAFAGAPLMLLRNDGTGTFTDASAQLPVSPIEGTYLRLVDVDGDGDLDLLAACHEYQGQLGSTGPVYTTLLFLNDGAGTFTDVSAAQLPAVTSYGLSVLDLDGDGDLDVAQGGLDLINDGAGGFTAVPVAPAARQTADFDEDGIPDRVYGTGDTMLIAGSPVTFWEMRASRLETITADLDGDRDLDLLVLPLHSGMSLDWAMLRIEVLYNQRRDLRLMTIPRLGQPLRLALRAGNGAGATAVLPALSVGRLPVPVPVPGLGQLVLDPATLVLLPFQFVPDADTAVEVSVPIPDVPAFQGLELAAQALFGNGPQGALATLSNAVSLPIER